MFNPVILVPCLFKSFPSSFWIYLLKILSICITWETFYIKGTFLNVTLTLWLMTLTITSLKVPSDRMIVDRSGNGEVCWCRQTGSKSSVILRVWNYDLPFTVLFVPYPVFVEKDTFVVFNWKVLLNPKMN